MCGFPRFCRRRERRLIGARFGRWRKERFGRARCLTVRYSLLLSVWICILYVCVHSILRSDIGRSIVSGSDLPLRGVGFTVGHCSGAPMALFRGLGRCHPSLYG